MHKQCLRCNARCCRYFCFQIGDPCTYEEFEQVRWYLAHSGISVHVDPDGGWWIFIENRCRCLEDTKAGPRCVAYANRPLICRRFSPDTCDFTCGPYDYEERFETADQLEAYARRVLGDKEFEAARAKARGTGKRPKRKPARKK
ncbi:MAG: YkgJ family cysteine cluster protein [Phycisphaerae bacterium]|nr:YkgJ family cysteine cluster protein [Phycisphaerae bacterium]